jgi:MFS transporter, FHS family, glucose/mannose:H+ symporter
MRRNEAAALWSLYGLYAGFALTGIGTTLLGCILPNLLVMWRLNDSQAGTLFASQFAGSSLGAALVGGNYFKSTTRGYLLLIAGALSLAYFSHSPHVSLFFVFGLGLGLTMTATSMLTGSLFPTHRAAALSILNACWCLGAILCPLLASFWTRYWPARGLFLALGFAVLLVCFLIGRIGPPLATTESDSGASQDRASSLILIFGFAFMAFLYVGVEVSVSGWMMTYVRRVMADNQSWSPAAVAGFWIALFGGRATAPLLLKRIADTELLGACILGAIAGVLSLILSHSPITILVSAACSGFVLAPIFPLCMAKVLSLAHDSPKTKWIFGTSGLGGALLPWLTGKLSAHKDSLSAGLVLPVGVLGFMLVQLFTLRKFSRT